MQTEHEELARVLPVGTKIKFDSEKQRYTVQASNDRFIILTKPFNAQKTYLYTIVDLERGIRGKCNLIFGLPCDVNSQDGAKQVLSKLKRGRMAVSRRNCVSLSEQETRALKEAK